MCAILDANVMHEIFSKTNDAGKAFWNWITEGNHRLVIGGKNRQELGKRQTLDKRQELDKRDGWISQLIQSGRIRQIDDVEVNNLTDQIKRNKSCQSNDEHIIALAQISGARLLYTNDQLLQKDFGKKELIDKPRGKVYSTQKTDKYDNSKFDEVKRRLLSNKNLCR